MSNIFGTYTCKLCGNDVKYAWVLADGVFGATPACDKYVMGNQNKMGDKYEVCVQCPKCKHRSSFDYSLDGKYIGAKG